MGHTQQSIGDPGQEARDAASTTPDPLSDRFVEAGIAMTGVDAKWHPPAAESAARRADRYSRLVAEQAQRTSGEPRSRRAAFEAEIEAALASVRLLLIEDGFDADLVVGLPGISLNEAIEVQAYRNAVRRLQAAKQVLEERLEGAVEELKDRLGYRDVAKFLGVSKSTVARAALQRSGFNSEVRQAGHPLHDEYWDAHDAAWRHYPEAQSDRARARPAALAAVTEEQVIAAFFGGEENLDEEEFQRMLDRAFEEIKSEARADERVRQLIERQALEKHDVAHALIDLGVQMHMDYDREREAEEARRG